MTMTVITKSIEARWVEMQRAWNLQRSGFNIPPGRNELPECLYDYYSSAVDIAFGEDGQSPFFLGDARPGVECRIDTALLGHAVLDAWGGAEYPERYLDADIWVDMFLDAKTGLLVPDEPLTLYRGVRDPEHRVGMSWTSKLDTAQWFANRFSANGVIYKIADVNLGYVLAKIDDGRDEGEYVLDPSYVEEVFDDAPAELAGGES